MNTADSREYNLLPSNRTKPNMHKTNTRLQALAKGSNYLCNNKAAKTVSHVAAYAGYIFLMIYNLAYWFAVFLNQDWKFSFVKKVSCMR